MRPLTELELTLVRYLLSLCGREFDLSTLRVQPMDDGGMGSLRFLPTDQTRKFGSQAAACHFPDLDGTLVSAALNLDQSEQLYELDVWRVDFAPVQKWPAEYELRPGVG